MNIMEKNSVLTDIKIDDQILTEILQILKPVKFAIQKLSDSQINYIDGLNVIDYLTNKLSLLADDLPQSKILLSFLKKRIVKRRNYHLESIVGLINKKTNSVSLETQLFFEDFQRKLSKQIPTTEIEIHSENESIEEELACLSDNEDEEYLNFLKTKSKQEHNSPSHDLSIFIESGLKTEKIQEFEKAMKKIRPTSTQCERNFSIAKNILNDNRLKLSDKYLEATMWLKINFDFEQSRLKIANNNRK